MWQWPGDWGYVTQFPYSMRVCATSATGRAPTTLCDRSWQNDKPLSAG